MSMEKSLKEILDEILDEVEQELEEATTTGNVAGYQTPHAFSDKGKKDKKRKKKIATALGYSVVGGDVNNINEGKFKPSQVRSAISRIKKQLMRKWKQKGGYENFGQKELRQLQNKFDYNAYGDKDEREISHMLDAFDNWAMNYDGSMRESVNEASDSEIKKSIKKNSKGGPYSVVVQKGNMSKHISHAKDVGNDINKVIKVYNQFKKKHRAGVQIIDGYGKTVFFESINEAKAKRPVNRWLELKNDESMHPHKKMAMGLKELKYQLREVEKFFNWYNKIKTINELDSDKYWKRTNRHIYTIKEKLIKIAKTIQEIEK